MPCNRGVTATAGNGPETCCPSQGSPGTCSVLGIIYFGSNLVSVQSDLFPTGMSTLWPPRYRMYSVCCGTKLSPAIVLEHGPPWGASALHGAASIRMSLGATDDSNRVSRWGCSFRCTDKYTCRNWRLCLPCSHQSIPPTRSHSSLLHVS